MFDIGLSTGIPAPDLTRQGCCIILIIRNIQQIVCTMTELQISIGRVKRDISDLVNRVAYGGERIILTSRGKPKAAIVSIEDYERLAKEETRDARRRFEAWSAGSEQLSAEILARRQGEPLDIDTLWGAARAELEERDARPAGR